MSNYGSRETSRTVGDCILEWQSWLATLTSVVIRDRLMQVSAASSDILAATVVELLYILANANELNAVGALNIGGLNSQSSFIILPPSYVFL